MFRQLGARKRLMAAVGVLGLLFVCAGFLVVDRPQFDPYGWLLWGRELERGTGFSTADYPSWKPLAALLGVPLAFVGPAAPTAWLVCERLLAFAGLCVAYLIGRRLAGRAAGALAVVSVVLVSGWLGETLDGHLEPVIVTLLLGACWLDAGGRRVLPFVLLALAALARPDAWPLLALYGLVVVRERPRALALVALIGLAVPVLWFGGDIVGSGSAFRGGNLARESTPQLLPRGGPSPPIYALEISAQAPLAVLAVAAAGAFWMGLRRRHRLILTLGLASLAWLTADTALAALGYPVDTRFVVPAGALISVLGASGLVAGTRAVVRSETAERRLAYGLAATAALVVSGVPAVKTAVANAREARTYSSHVEALESVAERLQPNDRGPCVLTIAQPLRAPFAWYSGKPLTSVVAKLHPRHGGVRRVCRDELLARSRRAFQSPP